VKEYSQRSKVYFAATSELYGQAEAVPQNEQTPFHPRSPYAVSKLAGFWTMKNYREAYGLHLTNGILFNHESEHRGPEFVTRKITQAAARLVKQGGTPLRLGNLDAKRDWGFAGDYVDGMWRMLQLPEPGDYVLATGETRTVREFAERVFARAGLPLLWQGTGREERGLHRETGATLLEIDPGFYRPAEVDLLMGDASKAREAFGWAPQTSFDELVVRMVDADLNRV
jgi:GDPmannose 4,6-dehydratase